MLRRLLRHDVMMPRDADVSLAWLLRLFHLLLIRHADTLIR